MVIAHFWLHFWTQHEMLHWKHHQCFFWQKSATQLLYADNWFSFQTQNTVYEIVSDMSSRQDNLEDRLTTMEDKIVALQEQLELLPDLLVTRIQAQVTALILHQVVSLLQIGVFHYHGRFRRIRLNRGGTSCIQSQQRDCRRPVACRRHVRGPGP